MTPRLRFKPADLSADSDTLIHFARDLHLVSFGHVGKFERDFGANGEGYLAWISERLRDGPDMAVIGFDGPTAIGLVVLGSWAGDPAVGYVFHYYLAPGARGVGLGEQLDRCAMQTLSARGFEKARLSVAERNAHALRFYLRTGWRHAGPRADSPGVLFMDKATSASERE